MYYTHHLANSIDNYILPLFYVICGTKNHMGGFSLVVSYMTYVWPPVTPAGCWIMPIWHKTHNTACTTVWNFCENNNFMARWINGEHCPCWLFASVIMGATVSCIHSGVLIGSQLRWIWCRSVSLPLHMVQHKCICYTMKSEQWVRESTSWRVCAPEMNQNWWENCNISYKVCRVNFQDTIIFS